MSGVNVFAEVMIVIITSLAGLLALVIATRYLWKRTTRAVLSAPRADDDRLQRLEEAVDTIAVEMERMSEAQRFTAKLLLERGNEAPQGQPTQAKLPDSIKFRG